MYEMWEDDKFYFLVMEYCEGGDLLDFIAENDHFPE